MAHKAAPGAASTGCSKAATSETKGAAALHPNADSKQAARELIALRLRKTVPAFGSFTLDELLEALDDLLPQLIAAKLIEAKREPARFEKVVAELRKQGVTDREIVAAMLLCERVGKLPPGT